VEHDHEAQVFGGGLTLFHFENSRLLARIIEYVLKGSGLYWRGCKNAERIEVRRNRVSAPELPAAFAGFTILHLSDLHCDMSDRAMARLATMLPGLKYDICVLTGDFRGATYGPFESAMATIAQLKTLIPGPVYGVLGNHDSVRMLRRLEQMDIRMLMNEAVTVERGGDRIHIAGIDDAHFYRTDNIEKAAADIPREEFSILLSHTPEIYRLAAHVGFSLILSGHTHGGQICLPGGIPVTLSSKLPRRLGAGAWRHRTMQGYTSVGAGTVAVPARVNCAPEITLHALRASEEE
jgi:predicted MPP superfamily phosphohydrolase